jgi:hypothetical protein
MMVPILGVEVGNAWPVAAVYGRPRTVAFERRNLDQAEECVAPTLSRSRVIATGGS